ncbi:hypothetical protein F2Q70_00029253 [Brassica cretica]|uniref:Uncharacterized protein n=1 Tax=Brassica cretica TaxID=69181 RepID=A0A8S9FD45_BRACR|nr:hypothetical protein F2Q70_00029253 [Brassica cretica]
MYGCSSLKDFQRVPSRIHRSLLIMGCFRDLRNYSAISGSLNRSLPARRSRASSPLAWPNSKLTPLSRWTCASYQGTDRVCSFVGPMLHIRQQSSSGISAAFPQLLVLHSASSPPTSAVAAGELSGKLLPPSVVAADDSAESTRLINSVDSLELFETDTETDFCMEVQPTLVDRLHCNLRMSINRLQAVSEHYLELSFVVGPLVGGECAPR